jgi:hypothetical protein
MDARKIIRCDSPTGYGASLAHPSPSGISLTLRRFERTVCAGATVTSGSSRAKCQLRNVGNYEWFGSKKWLRIIK